MLLSWWKVNKLFEDYSVKQRWRQTVRQKKKIYWQASAIFKYCTPKWCIMSRGCREQTEAAVYKICHPKPVQLFSLRVEPVETSTGWFHERDPETDGHIENLTKLSLTAFLQTVADHWQEVRMSLLVVQYTFYTLLIQDVLLPVWIWLFRSIKPALTSACCTCVI